MDAPDKILFTRRETAALLEIGLTTLWSMVRAGQIRAARKGRRVLFYRDEIERVARKDMPVIGNAKFDSGNELEVRFAKGAAC